MVEEMVEGLDATSAERMVEEAASDFPGMRPVDEVYEVLLHRETDHRAQMPLNFEGLDKDDPFRIDRNEQTGVNTPFLNFTNGDRMPLAKSGLDHLCVVLGIDTGYYNSPRMPPELREIIPNVCLRRLMTDTEMPVPIGHAPSEICPKDRLGVFLVDGAVSAFVDTDHVRVPAYKVLDAVMNRIDSEHCLVRTLHTEEDHVTVDLLSPNMSTIIERVMGKPLDFTDRTFAGMSFTHNDAGSGVTQLRTFLWRQWCLNGATIQHPIRMTRLSVKNGVDEAEERYLAALGDSTKQFWAEVPTKYFSHLRAMAETPYLGATGELDTELAFAEFDDIPGVPANIKDLIREAFAAEPMGYSQYGVMNAITRVAHMDSIDYPTQRRLEAYGGYLLHHQVERCTQCRQKIRQRAPRKSRLGIGGDE